MLPNNQTSRSRRTPRPRVAPIAPVTSESLRLIISAAPAVAPCGSRRTVSSLARVLAPGTSSNSGGRFMPPPPPPTVLPNFNEAFNFVITRRILGAGAPPQSPASGMLVTSAVQAPRISSAAVTTEPVAGTSSSDDVPTMPPPPSYHADHIEPSRDTHSAPPPYCHGAPSPPQQTLNRDPRTAARHRYPRLEKSQIQAKIQSELQREDRQNEALDLTSQRDMTAPETPRLPRPPRPWSQPPSIEFASFSHHGQEIQRHKSLPPTLAMPPLPTRATLRKVPDDEVEDYWNEIMEFIKKDLENMGLDENDLEPHKPDWSQEDK